MKNKLPKKSSHIIGFLNSFQLDLLKIYGENLQKIILFGSYARGDFRQGSDIDLLLLFDDSYNPSLKDDEVYDKVAAMVLENQYLISLMPVSEKLFESKKAPLYLNIKKEGVEIWRR